MATPLAPAIQAVVDKSEIRDVFARYCRGIDRLDAELIASVYHPNAYDDHGTYKGPPAGFVQHVIPGLRAFTRTMHFLGTSNIELDGDTAHCETYCVAYHRRALPDGSESDMVAGVRYVDRVERREGGPWLIAHRVVVFEWSRIDPVGQSWSPEEQFTRGRRDRTDLVYER